MRPAPRTKTNDFTRFLVADCDGNNVEHHDDSDSAYLGALRCVRHVWATFEVGQICGVLASGVTIPLIRFQRVGPKRDKGAPGSRCPVRFELEDFPFVTWTEE